MKRRLERLFGGRMDESRDGLVQREAPSSEIVRRRRLYRKQIQHRCCGAEQTADHPPIPGTKDYSQPLHQQDTPMKHLPVSHTRPQYVAGRYSLMCHLRAAPCLMIWSDGSNPDLVETRGVPPPKVNDVHFMSPYLRKMYKFPPI